VKLAPEFVKRVLANAKSMIPRIAAIVQESVVHAQWNAER
jgi:hypothetical protein